MLLASSGEISTNQAPAQHYQSTFKGDDAIFVEKAYQWRMNNLTGDKERIIDFIDKGLVKLYNQFLIIHIEKLTSYNELELAN